MPASHPLAPSALARAESLLAQGGRRLLGLAGPPGGGKSTLASALAAHLGPRAVVVPMDGFHLANSELARLGRAARKGAPDTFDAAGFVSLLQRLRRPVAGETVYAPEFRREIEEALAGAIAVPAEVELVITEGNYLLLDEGPWRAVRPLLDEAWYVSQPEPLRLSRLLARHVQHGRTPEAAAAWVQATDEPNARRIEATRPRADWCFEGA
jgi:pantothenate kinase